MSTFVTHFCLWQDLNNAGRRLEPFFPDLGRESSWLDVCNLHVMINMEFRQTSGFLMESWICWHSAAIFSLTPTSCCTLQTCLYYLRVRWRARRHRATGADRVSRGRDFIKWKFWAAETTPKISMQPGWQDLWVRMCKHVSGKNNRAAQSNAAESEESRVWKQRVCAA